MPKMGKSNKRDKYGGQGPFENRSNSNCNSMKAFTPKKSMKTSTFFSDPLLIPRINQYLSDNKDKVYVDINDMVSELQMQYRDYARRKRNAFKPLVERAFSFVLQQCGVTQGSGTDMNNYEDSSENSSSEVEECNASDGDGSKTSANNQLINLYSSPLQGLSKHFQTCSNDNTELIDLSSDDDSKKKDSNEDKNLSAAKLNNLQSRIASKETTLTVVKSGTQNQTKIDRPNITITAKRNRDAFEPKQQLKSLKKRKNQIAIPKTVTFSDFGGNPKLLEEVCKLILHISHPEIYREVGVSSPRGFLLHGPPGCGKTLLANAIAGELEVELIQVSAPELIGGVSGESEERIRDLFEKAVECAPCVLFIDEVDAICPNRENAQKEMERRIVAQLLTCLDELGTKVNGDLVLVIGATNRPDSIDPALRRAGRFDREVCLGIPDLKSREKILRILCSNLNLSSDFFYEELAQITPGFVGADLLALTREAAMIAVNRYAPRKFSSGQICGRSPGLGGSGGFPDSATLRKREGLKRSHVEGLGERAHDSFDFRVFGMLQSFRTKERNPKGKKLKADKLPMGKDNLGKSTDETMDVDLVENKDGNVSNKPGNEQPCDFQTCEEKKSQENSENKIKDELKQFLTGKDEERNGEKENEVEDEGKEKAESAPGPASGLNPPECTNISKEEIKLAGSDDEIDVEVISDNARSTQPSLDTLLYWLRDSSPLPYRKLKNISITQEDFKEALNVVQPSAKREGFATVPDVTWNDVGSLADVREELQMSILGPVKYRKQFEQLGLSAPAGILICGPPGCGKTLLAKAVANEAGVNFISVKGPELLNMYVGESERAVRRCFQRARNSAPCVIFFDELDALCPRRSDSGENGAGTRVVNQLLTEMDGVEDRKEVYLMAATNRPDIIDPAVLRPGRLDKIIYVGLPEAEDRVDILRALTKNGTRPKLSEDVDLREIALKKECSGYSGADLAALIREAGIQVVKELMGKSEFDPKADVAISLKHFEKALKKIRPSVAPEDQKYYDSIRRKYATQKT